MAMKKNALLVQFDNARFGNIRGLLIDGDPWFVGRDVAIALGYVNTKDALAIHVPQKYKRIINAKTLKKMASESKGRETPTFEFDSPRGLTFINEAGLYKLVFKSNLPAAEDFSDWVCEDIMPNIRKHGFYAVNPEQQKWLAIREKGKVERRNFTDTIQLFNQRDFPDGDHNPQARARYSRLTAKTQTNVLGILAGGRDTATGRDLAALLFAESAITNAMNHAYEDGNDFDQAEARAVAVAKQVSALVNGELQLIA